MKRIFIGNKFSSFYQRVIPPLKDSLIETSISKDILMLTRVDKPALLTSQGDDTYSTAIVDILARDTQKRVNLFQDETLTVILHIGSQNICGAF